LPFGVDDVGNAPLDLVGITNPSERPDNNAIGSVYSELSRLAPFILEKQGAGGITAALLESDAQRAARLSLGEFTANITRAGGGTGSRVAAMFLQTGLDEFLVTGVGDAQITFSSDKPGHPASALSASTKSITRMAHGFHGDASTATRIHRDRPYGSMPPTCFREESIEFASTVIS
jgi:hypothetical protein